MKCPFLAIEVIAEPNRRQSFLAAGLFEISRDDANDQSRLNALAEHDQERDEQESILCWAPEKRSVGAGKTWLSTMRAVALGLELLKTRMSNLVPSRTPLTANLMAMICHAHRRGRRADVASIDKG